MTIVGSLAAAAALGLFRQVEPGIWYDDMRTTMSSASGNVTVFDM